MTYVDVHCHLDFKDFDSNREELIRELKEKNIISFSNTLNPSNFEYTKELFKGHDHIKVLPGLYPQDAEVISDEEMDNYLAYLESESETFVGIGEIGLDRHNTSDLDLIKIQERRFRQLVELAIKLDKPMFIHSRKMEARVLEIIREYVEKTGFRKFNLHCFCGKKKLIKEIKELKIYVSIPLIILNTESFRFLVEGVKMSQILVETDSPFLNPSRERNSPLNVPEIYREIAKIKGYDEKEIENIIFRNYQKILM